MLDVNILGNNILAFNIYIYIYYKSVKVFIVCGSQIYNVLLIFSQSIPLLKYLHSLAVRYHIIFIIC